MSIVKVTNKNTGITYAYESQSYWDKEKQQPRNKRKLIGKIDPVTGEIVPTNSKKNRTEDEVIVSYKRIISGQEEEIKALKAEIRKLKDEKEAIIKTMDKMVKEIKGKFYE